MPTHDASETQVAPATEGAPVADASWSGGVGGVGGVGTSAVAAGLLQRKVQRRVQARRAADAGPAAINADVSETVTENIEGAPAPYGAWSGEFSWDSKFHLTIDPAAKTVLVAVRAFSAATKDVKAKWKKAIESKWSGHFCLAVAGATAADPVETYLISVHLDFVDDEKGADYTIAANGSGADEEGRAGQGGTTSMTGWGTQDSVDVTHEFGHMLGNPEDYFKTNGKDHTAGGKKRGFRDQGGGVMNNPSEDPFTQHYELIRQKAAAAMKLPDARVTVRPSSGK